MEEALPKKEYHFVEIMACPGGCIAGGGQPVSFGRGMEAKKLRQEAVYALDRKASYGSPMRTPRCRPCMRNSWASLAVRRPMNCCIPTTCGGAFVSVEGWTAQG